MSALSGLHIAVFGLGRSGLAIGKAALALGAYPVVYDEKSEESLPKRDVLEEARAIGLPVILGSTPLSSRPTLSAFSRDGAFGQRRFVATENGEGMPDLLVTNPAIDMRHPVLREAVDRGIEVISEVEFAYRLSKAPIVAVTGTNGKSTTTVMTYLCLKSAGAEAVLCGNIFGSGYPEVPLTEAAQSSTTEQILVAEISSFQLEWVREFRPICAGITNVTPDHQDRYDSFDQYAESKKRIYRAQKEGDYSVFRPDDPLTTPSQHSGTWLTFGPEGQDSRVEGNHLRILDRRIPLAELPFTETHNLINACMAGLMAYGALRHKGVQHEESLNGIVAGLKQFHGLAHRMQKVGECDGVQFVNNSMCTNPDAVVKSVSSLGKPAHILMGGLNKGLDFTPVSEFLKNSPHRAYIYGASREELATVLANGDRSGLSFLTFATMQDAFAKAVQNAKSGEVVILAPGCASMDQFHDFRDRGNVFTSLAMEWLQTCSAP